MRRVLFYCFALIALAIIGCDETDIKDNEPEPIRHTVLGKYGINEGDIDELYSYLEVGSEAWLMASKENKLWLRLYDKNTFNLIKQWSIPQNAQYNTITSHFETETGYVFTVRTTNTDLISKNAYIITADNNKESVDLIYTLTENDWLNTERGPERPNETPKLEIYRDYFYIHSEGQASPVFRELLINRQGMVINDVSKTIIGDLVYFGGFYKEKVWVGIFNNNTKVKIDEWTANETFNRNILINGDSESYYIRSILLDKTNLIHTNKGTTISLRYSKEVGSKDFSRTIWEVLGGDIIFLNSDKDTAIIGKAGFFSKGNINDIEHFYLQNWEEDNLMFKIRRSFSSEYSTFIFSHEGVLLEEI